MNLFSRNYPNVSLFINLLYVVYGKTSLGATFYASFISAVENLN
jgi:hypothetical protein